MSRVATGFPLPCEVCGADMVEDDLVGPDVLCPRCNEMRAWVAERFAEFMALQPNQPFPLDLDLVREINSLDESQFLMELEDRYRVSFDSADYAEVRTVRELLRLILLLRGDLA